MGSATGSLRNPQNPRSFVEATAGKSAGAPKKKGRRRKGDIVLITPEVSLCTSSFLAPAKRVTCQTSEVGTEGRTGQEQELPKNQQKERWCYRGHGIWGSSSTLMSQRLIFLALAWRLSCSLGYLLSQGIYELFFFKLFHRGDSQFSQSGIICPFQTVPSSSMLHFLQEYYVIFQ